MWSPDRQSHPPAAAGRRTRVAVVGNAPPAGDDAAAIDGCDRVVRINRAPGFGARRGRRVDVLVLINCGGQMAEWLDTDEIFRSGVFAAAPEVVLPIHPGKADLIVPPLTAAERDGAEAQDGTAAALRRIAAAGKAAVVWPATYFAAAMADLGHAPLRRTDPAPSTGYLAARRFVEEGCDVHAFGFGFEGWDGHDFAAERRWFEAIAAAGRLVLHPPATAEARAWT